MTTPPYNQTLSQVITDRLSELFVQLGLDKLPPEKQGRMLERMLDIISGKVSLHLEQILDKRELEMLDHCKDGEELRATCLGFGINLSDMVLVETQALREDFVATTAYVRGFLDSKEGSAS